MLFQKTYFQAPGRGSVILDGLIETATHVQPDALLVTIAYATEGGCRSLSEALGQSLHNWTKVNKRWILSIDYGHTEPEALSFLSKLPNSKLSIANGPAVLARRLHPVQAFHPKAYCFYTKSDNHIGYFSGSANLTNSALHHNYEQALGIAVKAPLVGHDNHIHSELTANRNLMADLFLGGYQLDNEFLTKYATERKQSPRVIDDLPRIAAEALGSSKDPVTRHKLAALATASNFWIDCDRLFANRQSLNLGNQLDLQNGTRVFFGVSIQSTGDNKLLKVVNVDFLGQTYECRLRRSTNKMDKIYLPANNEVGVPFQYDYSTLLFTRQLDGTFRLQRGSEGDRTRWKSKSLEQGTAFKFGGQSIREFGVFEGDVYD